MKKILNNKVLISLFIILLLAAFLRLYNISNYMTFLGDEGRDALVAKGILEGNLTFLGPRASAGDFFLGPIYYYFMAPFLLVSLYDPVGPAIMVALLSVVTVYLIYRFGREWFGLRTGLMAAALYAVSPLVIVYSRSSWNPNPMPFFSLLTLYILYRAVKEQSLKKFIIVGVLFGITMQLHYLAVFLGVIIGLFVLASNFFRLDGHSEVKSKNHPVEEKTLHRRSFAMLRMTAKNIMREYLQIAIGFIVGISPFLLFEIRHGFPNTITIFNFIFVNNAQAEYKGGQGTFVDIVGDVFFRVFGRLVTRFPSPDLQHLFSEQSLQIWHLLTLILAIFAIVILFRIKNKLVVLLFSIWLVVGVVLFGIYKKPIYDYYFEFMFPLPFLLVGNALGNGLVTFTKQKVISVIGVFIFLGLVIFNLLDMPFRYPPTNQKQTAEKVADFILTQSQNKPYNFALITKGNSDHAYRYFFHIKNQDPVRIENTIIDPQRKTVTDQLLVICDYPDCEPLGNSLFEVAGFGRADIAGKWSVAGFEIYRLVHYKGK